MTYLVICAIFPLTFQIICAFYLPGLAPVTFCRTTSTKLTKDYCQNEVPVFVNRLNSLQRLIPYEYDRFDFCDNDGKDGDPEMNLGQVVFGERIKPSPYKFQFGEDTPCVKVCEKKYIPGNKTSLEKLDFMRKAIELNYRHNWIVDNMPVSWCYEIVGGDEYCLRSFPVGCYVTRDGVQKDACVMSIHLQRADTHYFFNHIELTITYHPSDNDSSSGRILSVKATLKSIAYGMNLHGDHMCQPNGVMGITNGALKEETIVRYTYSVRWKSESRIKWSSRWNYILDANFQNIQLFSIINSVIIVLIFAWIMAMLFRNILSKKTGEKEKKGFTCCWRRTSKYSDNWKLLYGDIFRAPNCGMLLAVLNGSGVQLFATSVIVLVLASIGVLSPPNRGGLETCILLFYVCLGFPAGYVSSKLYKSFGGKKKFLNALLTGTVCPGVVFALMLITNFVYMMEGSSAVIPTTTVLALLGLWLGISLPLTMLGSFFGFRRKGYHHPVKTSETARPVPKRRLRLKQVVSMIIAGILPFGTLFIQLFFIFNSMFSYLVYYNFGYLAIVFILMVPTCSVISIIISYSRLSAENYHWWWHSFLCSGFTAVYAFLYGIHYYMTKTDFNGAGSAVNYCIYMFVMAFLLFLVTGSIGFFASFWFMRKIYSTVKGCEMWSTKEPDI